MALTITTEDVARFGVVGAGGAGFPTHVKLSGKADTVVLNAAECEPLLHKDKELILRDAAAIVEGLARAVEFVGAKEAVVGIKEKYAKVIAAMPMPRAIIIDGIKERKMKMIDFSRKKALYAIWME